MFTGTALTSFTLDLPKLKFGDAMFSSSTIASFTSAMPELEDGSYMFSNCLKLTSITLSLPKLKDAQQMFDSCKALKTLSLDAPLLENCSSMLSFSSDVVGTVTSVHLNAPKLTKGTYAFYYCTSLVSFSGDLSSLLYGNGMFMGCKLDGQSVATIYNSIPTITLPKGSSNHDYLG